MDQTILILLVVMHWVLHKPIKSEKLHSVMD